MAKRHRSNLITASFHYLIKTSPNEADPARPLEHPFTEAEFQRVVARISDANPIDENDPAVIERIKGGLDLPFSEHEIVDGYLHFGNFDGAYYGQEYRNNVYGVISADSLNLRTFHYLITLLRDGKILVGVTYNAQFGDYEGMKKCLTHLLGRGNHNIRSRTITSLREDIGTGTPIELRLIYRNANNRPERRGIFGQTGVFAIKSADFGEGFQEAVLRIADEVAGDTQERKRKIAELVKQGNLIELDDDDIVGCSAIVRENGRTTTVYFIGGSNMATKFRLDVEVNGVGIPDREQVKNAIIGVMREKIMPLLA